MGDADEDLTDVFNSVDVDGSGSIDAGELGVLCEHLGFKLSNRQLRKALEAMDEDKSGEVSFDEFSDWWAAAGLGKGNLEREGKLWDAFCDIDKDDSGFIDKDELKALTIAVGMKMSDAELDKALVEMDDDHSGEINFEEFAGWFHNSASARSLAVGLGLGLSLGISSLDAEAIEFHDASSSDEEDLLHEAMDEAKDAFSNLLAASFGGSHEVKGLSLGMFPPDNAFRLRLSRIVFHPACEVFILLCIFANLISLLFQTPGENESAVVGAINFFCSMVFTAEMVLRIVVHGFFKHEGAYLRNGWNAFDFIIVTTFWVILIGSQFNDIDSSLSFSATLLRSFRVMRFFSGVREVLNSLGEGSTMILTVCAVMGYLFIVFSVTGRELFGGVLTHTCQSENATLARIECPECTDFVSHKDCPLPLECEAKGKACYKFEMSTAKTYSNESYYALNIRLHHTDKFGFDNIFMGLSTVYTVSTVDEWNGLCDAFRDAQTSTAFLAWPVFSLLVIFLSLFAVNLFVASLTISYMAVRQQERNEAVFDDLRSTVIENLKHASVDVLQDMEGDGPVVFDPSLNAGMSSDSDEDIDGVDEDMAHEVLKVDHCMGKCVPCCSPAATRVSQKIIQMGCFDSFIMTTVMANIVIMGTEHHDMAESYIFFLMVMEYTFTVIYTFECTVKLQGLGCRRYFKNWMNQLDFTIVFVALLGYGLELVGRFYADSAEMDASSTSALRIVRVLARLARLARVARIGKLISRVSSIKRVLRVAFKSWSAIISLSFLFLFVLLISAMMGTFLFWTCHANGVNAEFGGFNLGRLGDAIVANFILSTGDDWSNLMYEYMDCFGSKASVYFVIVVFVTQYVLLNLYVAVFLENFSLSDEEKRVKQVKKYLRQTMQNVDADNPADVASTTVAVSNAIQHKGAFRKLNINHIVEAVSSGARSVTKPVVGGLDQLAKGAALVTDGVMDAAKQGSEVPRNLNEQRSISNRQEHLNPLNSNESFDDGHTVSPNFKNPIQELDDMDGEENGSAVVEEGDLSLGIFPEDSAFRIACTRMAENTTFVNLIVLFILLAGAHLAMEGPTSFKASGYGPWFIRAMESLDWFLFIAFWVECIMKCIAYGFVSTPTTYLRVNKANILDFSVVMITTIDVLLVVVFKVEAEWVRIFRLLRVFRLVRLLGILDGMNVILESLLHALPSVSAILALQATALAVFGILGINVFGGLYYRCIENIRLDRPECEAQGLSWERYTFCYDNIFEAFCSLFVCQTMEGWVQMLRIGMDTTTVDMAPSPNASSVTAFIFYASFIILNAFMLDKLFVGVLADFFAQESGSALMTAEQKNWRFMEVMVFHIIDTDRPPPVGNPLRRECYKIVQGHFFQRIVNVFILLDVGSIILLESGFVPSWLQVVFDLVNEMALGVYSYEIVIKVLAYGWHNYIGENKIAFMIVCVMWVMLIHAQFAEFEWFNKGFSFLDFIPGLQAVQIFRLTRLIEASRSIRKLMKLIHISLPQVFNLVIVMMLMYFIFGIIGMKLYGALSVEGDGIINHKDNFSDIMHAMMLLFQVSTGMPILDLTADLNRKSGGHAFVFFMAFYITSNFILLNLFTALLLDNLDLMDSGDYALSDADIHHFKARWNKHGLMVYDDIAVRRLREFVISVGGAFGIVIIADPFWFNRLLLELHATPDCVLENTATFSFHEVLLALCHMRFNSNCLPYELEIAAKERAEEYRREHAAKVIELFFRCHLMMMNPPADHQTPELRARFAKGIGVVRLWLLTSRLKVSSVSDAEAISDASTNLHNARVMMQGTELHVEGADMEDDFLDIGLQDLSPEHVQQLADGEAEAHDALLARVEEMRAEADIITGGIDTWCEGGRLIGHPFEVAQRFILVIIIPCVTISAVHIVITIIGEKRYEILSLAFVAIVVFPLLSTLGCIYIIASFYLHPGIFSIRRQMLMFSSWAGILNYGCILFGLTELGRGHCRLLAVVNQSAYFTQMSWQVMATYASFRYIKSDKMRVRGRARVIEQIFCWCAPTAFTLLLYALEPNAFNKSLDEVNGIGWCGVRSGDRYRLVKVLFVFVPQLLAVNLYAYFYYYINAVVDPPKEGSMKRTADETRLSTSNHEDLLNASKEKRVMAMVDAAKSIQLYMTAFMLSFLTNTLLTIIIDRLRDGTPWSDMDYMICAAVVTPQQFLYARVFSQRKTGNSVLQDVAVFHKATIKTQSGQAITNLSTQASTWKWAKVMKADKIGAAASVRLVSNVRQTQHAWEKVQREGKNAVKQRTKRPPKDQNKMLAFGLKWVNRLYFAVFRSAQILLFVPVGVWVWVPMDFVSENFVDVKKRGALAKILGALIGFGVFVLFPLFFFRDNAAGGDRGLIALSRFDIALSAYMITILSICLTGAWMNRYNASLLVITGPRTHLRLNKKNVLGCYTLFIEFFQIAFIAFTAGQLLGRYRPQDVNGTKGEITITKFIIGLILDNVFYVQYWGSLIAVGVWSMCYCIPAIATHIYTRKIAGQINEKLGVLFFVLSGPGFLTIIKSLMKPLFCLTDTLRYPDDPLRVLADRDVQCWSSAHLMMCTFSLVALCLYFPSATLTTAIKYSPPEDVRYVYLYIRLEFIIKGLMIFMALRFTEWPELALGWLMIGSTSVILIIHFMQPCCLYAVNKWKQMIHACQIWTCITCQWTLYVDNHSWKLHLLYAVLGWLVIWSCQISYETWKYKTDSMTQPPTLDTSVKKCEKDIKKLEHQISHASSLQRWGGHARILRILKFAQHPNVNVRRVAFESLAILSYLDQMTRRSMLINLAADTIMPILLSAIYVEEDEDLKVFAVRTLKTFLQEERHILELTIYNDTHDHDVAEVIAELGVAAERDSSKVDCMKCLLEMSFVDSNSLDAVARTAIPLLAAWAETGTVVQQHLSAELMMNVAGRFDLTRSLVDNGALPKLVMLFMAVDDITTAPDKLVRNTENGFRRRCLQPERVETLAHQLPGGVISDFQNQYKNVEALLSKHNKENRGSQEEEEVEVDKETWAAWMNSGTPLTREIKTKMSAGEIDGLSKVSRRAGVTAGHLDELFELIDEDGGGTLDEEEIADFLEKYGLGTKEELEQILLDTGLKQREVDNTEDEEIDLAQFTTWLLEAEGQDGLGSKIIVRCIPHEGALTAEQCEVLFNKIDDDGGGSLDNEEIADFLNEEGLGTVEELQAALQTELTGTGSEYDIFVQLSAKHLQRMKEDIMKSMVQTLTEIAVAQGGVGRNEMVTGGVMAIVKRCFSRTKPELVQVLGLNMLHALMNGRFEYFDIESDIDMAQFYGEMREFESLVGNPEYGIAPVLTFTGLSALQRRKAHTMAAYLGMYHRSIGSPVDREVLVSQREIPKEVGAAVTHFTTADMKQTSKLLKEAEAEKSLDLARVRGKNSLLESGDVNYSNPVWDRDDENAFIEKTPSFEDENRDDNGDLSPRAMEEINVPFDHSPRWAKNNATKLQTVKPIIARRASFESDFEDAGRVAVFDDEESSDYAQQDQRKDEGKLATPKGIPRPADEVVGSDAGTAMDKTDAKAQAAEDKMFDDNRNAIVKTGIIRALLSLCEIDDRPQVLFSALDTLLQFCKHGKIPERDLELVRAKLYWALEHPDVGIAVLGSWGLDYLLELKPARVWRGKAKFRTCVQMVISMNVWRKVGRRTGKALDQGQSEVRAALG